MPLQDVQVSIDVRYPAPKVGLGRPLILSKKTGAPTYKEYFSLDGVAADYAIDTAEYKKARDVFKQENRPDILAIATYETDPAATLEKFYRNSWHVALIASDVSADQVKAARYMGDKKFKFAVYQVSTSSARSALKGIARTVIFDHNIPGENLDAAAVGELASREVGSITWKFKGLAGITARYLTEDELTAIENDNANAYVMKAGKAQLSNGIMANGEFIDSVHGRDWIKADMENEIQRILQQADKLPFDARGINAVEAGATTTLERGFARGIIAATEDGLPDYNVSAKSREETDVQDRAARIYRGLTFDFKEAGAIHEVRINGAVEA